MTWRVELGDSREQLRALDDASVDAVVTDPPYELGFMGKKWDASGIAYDVGLWREVLRVLKPGGHLLAFGGTRTYHRMAVAIEDAGFEIRDSIHWVYGSGFPKSKSIGGGFGTALKPSHEPIVVARKPLIGTVAQNVLEHGTGALNIDGCRVATNEKLGRLNNTTSTFNAKNTTPWVDNSTGKGRWPSNVIFSHLPECRQVGFRKVKGGAGTTCSNRDAAGKCLGHENAGRSTSGATYHGPETATVNRTETVASWECAEGCAVAELDAQSGAPGGAMRQQRGTFSANATDTPLTNYSDTGGASRFFPAFRYQAKPSRAEREAGLREAGLVATHPTVKPIELMRWLVRLVTPPGGFVLDPFTGSGTTGCAAILERCSFVGVELSDKYRAIACARIEAAETGRPCEQLDLFGGW